MSKATEKADPGIDPAPESPSSQGTVETADWIVRGLRLQLGETLSEEHELLDELHTATASGLRAPRIQAFLVRLQLRVANLVRDHDTLVPLVARSIGLGVHACLYPSRGRALAAHRNWNQFGETLGRWWSVSTLRSASARKCGLVAAAATATMLETTKQKQIEQLVDDAVCVSFLIASGASAPGRSLDDFDRLHAAVFHDLAALSALPDALLAVSPWDDGPLGELWPAGAGSWYRSPTLAELRSWSDFSFIDAEPALDDTTRKEEKRIDDMDPKAKQEPSRLNEQVVAQVTAAVSELQALSLPGLPGAEERLAVIRRCLDGVKSAVRGAARPALDVVAVEAEKSTSKGKFLLEVEALRQDWRIAQDPKVALKALNAELRTLAGKELESYEANLEAVARIREAVARHNLQLVYDGQTVSIRCIRPPGSEKGSVQVRLNNPARDTVHSGKVWPKLSAQLAQ